jgi:hypothetical protein
MTETEIQKADRERAERFIEAHKDLLKPLTYRDLFEKVKDRLDDVVLIHGRDYGVRSLSLRCTEKESRMSADVVDQLSLMGVVKGDQPHFDEATDSWIGMIEGYPFLTF